MYVFVNVATIKCLNVTPKKSQATWKISHKYLPIYSFITFCALTFRNKPQKNSKILVGYICW